MSDMGFTPELVAGGTIFPFRLVKISGAFTGTACNAITDYACGVTDGSVYQFDKTEHAITGKPISLQPSNTVQLEVGTGGATAGSFLMAAAGGAGKVTDATGPTATSQYIALESGANGEIIRAWRFGSRQPVFT